MYTLDDVLKVVATLPLDRRNPTFGGSCVYTDTHNRHCIAGEVMVRLGIELPEVNFDFGHNNRQVFDSIPQADLFELDARQYLIGLQSRADHFGANGHAVWGDVIDETVEGFNL